MGSNDETKIKEELIQARDDRETIIDGLSDNDMADEIYVFIPSKQMGIKFYSRSPITALRTGVFETDIHSISKATWNEHINSKKGPAVFKYIDGQVVTCTYIVSEQTLLTILKDIASQKGNRKITINITNNDFVKEMYDILDTKDDKALLEEMKEQLLNTVPNNVDYPNISDKDKYEQYMDDNNELNRIVK